VADGVRRRGRAGRTAFVRIEFRLYGPGTLLVDHVGGFASPIFPPIDFLVPPSISGNAVVGETLVAV
jgi:hypothetical protein